MELANLDRYILPELSGHHDTVIDDSGLMVSSPSEAKHGERKSLTMACLSIRFPPVLVGRE